MENSFVSVIIPVYNDRLRLQKCLEVLHQQTYPLDELEIIVVDNGSNEPLDDLVGAFPRARLVRESRPGSYAARNRGICAARGDILAFTDADCVPAPRWIECGVKALRDTPNCGYVGGRVEPFFRDPDAPTATELYECALGFRQEDYVRKAGHAVTANMFTRRSVLSVVGEFNPKLKSGGDADWGKRTREAGYDAAYVRDAVVGHPTRHTWAEVYSQTKRIAGGIHDRRRGQKHAVLRFGQNIGLLALTLPTTALRIMFDRGSLQLIDKLKVVSVMAGVRGTLIWEQVRLQLGGGTSRR